MMLDPRTKDGAGFHYEDMDEIYEILQEWAERAIVNNEVSINQQYEAAIIQVPRNNFVEPVVRVVARVDQYEELFQIPENNILINNNIVNNDINEAHNNRVQLYVAAEIELYRNSLKLPRVAGLNINGDPIYNNPLLWWSQNALRFPVLAHLARKILCIPATSAPVERLFSHAGLTIANDRARLLPEMAEDLIFLHDAWDLIDELVLDI